MSGLVTFVPHSSLQKSAYPATRTAIFADPVPGWDGLSEVTKRVYQIFDSIYLSCDFLARHLLALAERRSSLANSKQIPRCFPPGTDREASSFGGSVQHFSFCRRLPIEIARKGQEDVHQSAPTQLIGPMQVIPNRSQSPFHGLDHSLNSFHGSFISISKLAFSYRSSKGKEVDTPNLPQGTRHGTAFADQFVTHFSLQKCYCNAMLSFISSSP